MPHYVQTIPSSWSADKAFSYMADFSNAEKWDPNVVSAKRLDDGTIKVGSAFELTVKVVGRGVPFRYDVTDMGSNSVTFTSHSGGMNSEDTITVVANGTGSKVIYNAQLGLRGVGRLINPLLALAFRRIAKQAGDSLATILG